MYFICLPPFLDGCALSGLHSGRSCLKSNGDCSNRHSFEKICLSLSMLLDANVAIENVYRSDWGRIVAALIRFFGDFELAEEVAQEAFAAAVDQWRISGIPESPRAWLIQTARHKAIDRIRRKMRFAEKMESYAVLAAGQEVEGPDVDATDISDDRLRLIFTCCHPA